MDPQAQVGGFEATLHNALHESRPATLDLDSFNRQVMGAAMSEGAQLKTEMKSQEKAAKTKEKRAVKAAVKKIKEAVRRERFPHEYKHSMVTRKQVPDLLNKWT